MNRIKIYNLESKVNECSKNVSREISCGAYVIDSDRVLMVQQKNGNHWDFPKGHIEPNETKQETAIREVFEETGIRIKIISNKEYKISYEPEINISKDVIFFEAIKIGGEIRKQEEEIVMVEWFEFKEALEKLTFENSKEMFKKFLNDKNIMDK